MIVEVRQVETEPFLVLTTVDGQQLRVPSRNGRLVIPPGNYLAPIVVGSEFKEFQMSNCTISGQGTGLEIGSGVTAEINNCSFETGQACLVFAPNAWIK